MKKILSLLLTLTVILNVAAAAAVSSFAATPEPVLVGETAILLDMKTGEILYSKNPDAQRYPASTTKIMTAILALENLQLSDSVTVDAETPFEVKGSHIALVPDEVLTTEQLLYGMMTESANDCALVLGKQISGSTEAFAELMNKRAAELGAKNTHFVNPNGLHNDAHLSTAYDLAMFARYAMTDPNISEVFRTLVTTYKYHIPATNKQDERFLYNTNRLLYDTVHKVTVNGEQRVFKYEGVTGVKTGYTSDAGGCLVASAERNGTELLCVVMKSTDDGRFGDCIAMLDWGFANYHTVSKMEKGTSLGTVAVKRGEDKEVEAELASAIDVTLPIELSAESLVTKTVLDETVQAPVKKGQQLGTVEIYNGDTLVTTGAAIAVRSVAEGGILAFFRNHGGLFKKIGTGILIVFLLLVLWLVVYILIKRRQVRLRKERRRQRIEARKREEAAQREAWEAEFERIRRESRPRR